VRLLQFDRWRIPQSNVAFTDIKRRLIIAVSCRCVAALKFLFITASWHTPERHCHISLYSRFTLYFCDISSMYFNGFLVCRNKNYATIAWCQALCSSSLRLEHFTQINMTAVRHCFYQLFGFTRWLQRDACANILPVLLATQLMHAF